MNEQLVTKRDSIYEGYVVDNRLFEKLFEDYSPHITKLLEKDNPILLNQITIYEYDRITKPVAGCYLENKIGDKGQHLIKFYFNISRSNINLICNFSGLFSVIVEKCNKNLYTRKAIRLQKKMAQLYLKALLGQKIETEPFIIGKTRKQLLHEYFFTMGLTFLFCHEIGHAILCYDGNRPELAEAENFIKSNKYLENDDPLIKKWTIELASDYLALKLFSMQVRRFSDDNFADDNLSNWSSILCLIHLYPCSIGAKTKNHPSQDVRINFLFQYARQLNFKMIGDSIITNYKLMGNIAELMKIEMKK